MSRAPIIARTVAIAIAIAASIDPVVRVRQTARPAVAVLAATPRDSVLATRARTALSSAANVQSEVDAGTDAAVVVGDALPLRLGDSRLPTIGVTPARARVARVRVVRAAGSAPAGGSTPVTVAIERDSTAPAALDVALEASGVTLARATVAAGPPATRVVTLPVATPDSAALSLRVVVRSGPSEVAVADVAIGSTHRPWRVLFASARSSYGARFVRRALADDPRFEIASTVSSSRGVEIAASSADAQPARLGDVRALGRFDAVVVGAPDALTADEAAGLTRFARDAGGSVVLLLDTAAPTPLDAALGVRGWTLRRIATAEAIPVGLVRGTSPIRTGEYAVPSSTPVAATALAGRNGEPVIWSTPVGAGEFIVSGALDAWRYRDRAASAFASAWSEWIANAASRAAPEAGVPLAPDATPAAGLKPDALAAWARGSGGSVFDEANLNQLPAAVIAAVQPPVYLVPVHPMRSPWWIVPFALLLSYEWWVRRKRGER